MTGFDAADFFKQNEQETGKNQDSVPPLIHHCTDSYFVYILKMEHVSKINIFGLRMTVKSGLEKIF